MVGWLIGDVGNADDSMVGGHGFCFAEIEGKIAGDDDCGFAIGKFIVEVATEIMVFGVISSCCAHVFAFLPFCFNMSWV